MIFDKSKNLNDSLILMISLLKTVYSAANP